MVATATSEDPYLDQHAWIVGDRELVKQALTHPKLGKDITLAPDWMRKPGQMVTAMPPRSTPV